MLSVERHRKSPTLQLVPPKQGLPLSISMPAMINLNFGQTSTAVGGRITDDSGVDTAEIDVGGGGSVSGTGQADGADGG